MVSKFIKFRSCDVMSKQEVQIYPNPVSDYVYIKNNKFKTYQLLDEMGRVIDSG
jgi:hypothetical protein